MDFPNISPIAFEIGPLVVRWYALAYVLGILIAERYVIWLNRKQPNPPLSLHAREDLILYGVLGVILGGRLGYVLAYNPYYYLDNPVEILHIWQGGMSFHGGFAGILIAFLFFARKHKVRWLQLMDLLAVATPIGLFLGRLANFINGELYGRVTTSAFGMVFPHGGPMPRHPSQLYEAALEGLILGLVLWYLATRTKALRFRGITGGVFVGGYGLSRFIVEFFREPDTQLGFLSLGLTMGQWLSLPMIFFGAWLVVSARKKPVTS